MVTGWLDCGLIWYAVQWWCRIRRIGGTCSSTSWIVRRPLLLLQLHMSGQQMGTTQTMLLKTNQGHFKYYFCEWISRKTLFLIRPMDICICFMFFLLQKPEFHPFTFSCWLSSLLQSREDRSKSIAWLQQGTFDPDDATIDNNHTICPLCPVSLPLTIPRWSVQFWLILTLQKKQRAA